MIFRKLVIFSHSAEHTTARYFERAARRSAEWADVRYISRSDALGTLDAESVLLLIDSIEDWPLGLEDYPCLRIAYLIDVHQDYTFRSNLGAWFDLLFVAQRGYVERLQADGHRHVYWLPLGADPHIHSVPGLERKHDVSFVGKLGDIGSRRFQILTEVLSKFRTNDYRRWHTPSEMGRVYSESKIVLNASINNDVNMRVFEGLMAGALLVTDRINNSLDGLFIEDEHYVGYSTAEEAITKIRYYLEHPAERSNIAEAGRRAALSGHTYAHRMQSIERIIPAGAWHGSALVNRHMRCNVGEAHANMFVALRKPLGVLSVIGRYGVTIDLAWQVLRGSGAWLNQRIPITPNAIRARRRAVRR
jgi:hypothetical protein